ncbi:MAG: hypothetical protein Q7R49_00375 [Candidatus Daviesbacteria bacterium]|nr:hypothetical protein [Candidatus Daviesbacteria bacterium]
MDNNKFTRPAGGSRAGVWFVATWFGAAITTLIFSFIFTFYLAKPKIVKPSVQSFKLYAALPKSGSAVSGEIGVSDARAKIIENFLKEYKAPLADQSNTFIQVADKYQLDWRLLPSIAMQESNGGKKIVADSYNPFGYGIYGGKVKRFTSFEEAIERVGKGLKEDYYDKGLTTPEMIMHKYTPPSIALGGPWAKGVLSFMEELK